MSLVQGHAFFFFFSFGYAMEEGLAKNFRSLKFWVNLFLLADLVLMLSQDVCYGKGSGQNSHSLEVLIIYSQ